jgi:hypothetical protein
MQLIQKQLLISFISTCFGKSSSHHQVCFVVYVCKIAQSQCLSLFKFPKNTIQEWNIVNSIKQKLADNNSLVTQADKGKTIVIIYEQEYDDYITTFISHNNFELLNKDPTNIFQKCIKDCKFL